MIDTKYLLSSLIYIKLPLLQTLIKVSDIETRIEVSIEFTIRPERLLLEPCHWFMTGRSCKFGNNAGTSYCQPQIPWISVSCLALAFCVWMLLQRCCVNLPKLVWILWPSAIIIYVDCATCSGKARYYVFHTLAVCIFGGHAGRRSAPVYSDLSPCVRLVLPQDTSTPL